MFDKETIFCRIHCKLLKQFGTHKEALVYLRAATTMMTRHSVDGLLRAITGRVRDGVTVRPARVATYTLRHAVLYVTYAVLVTHHVSARGN